MSRYLVILGLLASACLSACSESNTQSIAGTDTSDVLPPTVSYEDFGDYVVHFNATPTRELTAEVAGRYGILRSNNRALLNVSVLRKEQGTMGAATSATITASATNLTGQLKRLSLKELPEGDAIYYLAEVPITNAETLIFTLEITPEGSSETYQLSFKKQFFAG